MSARDPSDVTVSRRACLIGGGAFGATALIPGAHAAAPPLPDAKPTVPRLFRLGRKPEQPPRLASQAGPQGATGPARATAPQPATGNSPRLRALALDNINTGEHLHVTYMEHGRYIPDALAAINHLMRDRRSGAVATIDPGLLDLLSDLSRTLGASAPLRLISGYRAPKTNSRMRAQDHSVAQQSYHTRGMAADIALPGRSLDDLHRVAVAMGRGGVGAYPSSGFVHVDVGPPRTWQG
ncbi:DUF882 domain-containing protein [Roseospira marina]|uniref:Murein endopeptidase K n=1 Tax=Roseospira marina TaxID=140057 RepID=A0A5M6IFE5_9PROT|nr:DUF882 domain-containing protein [Roseospira marina]KAA5606953.1 DUF882 domain-containing protein [Roseospira marina]MBB4312871.1 uncharacterized protein YcbK (DUF882 family) [Roseospira marina]MBB5086356.1 uncharacterized protein YcbK (DUF882 family) [Roseospira marina]